MSVKKLKNILKAEKVLMEYPFKDSKEIIFFTDGSCLGNPGPGGYGVFAYQDWGQDDKKNLFIQGIARGSSLSTTNNREELKGILMALRIGKQNFPLQKIIVHSDSAYCVNICNSWIHDWAENNWERKSSKSPIENLDLIKKIYTLLVDPELECEIVKVKGHSGVFGNEIADALATGNGNKILNLTRKQNYDRVFYHTPDTTTEKEILIHYE